MRKKFPYQRKNNRNKGQNRRQELNKLFVSFSQKKMRLDQTELVGVTYCKIEQSPTGFDELCLKMIVDLKDLDDC